MSMDRKKRALAWGALLLSALALGGCSTSIADLPLIGTPADTPAAKQVDGFLPVEDLPPNRGDPVIPPDERAKIKAELLAARDRQASAVAGKDQADKDKVAKDQAAKDKAAKDKAAKEKAAKDQAAQDQATK
jgi:hypothetical protein